MMKISIIIPTYNRPNYLKRILSYYDQNKNDFKIIVADSSSEENKRLNKEVIFSLSNLKILYLDHYDEKISPSNKLTDALSQVESEYCLFCADDDFITLNGINQSVDFLENNQDFTIAHGRQISFYIKNKNNIYWKINDLIESNVFEQAKDRINEHLSKYPIPTFYGVHKTNFLKMIWSETLKFTEDERFGELLPSMLTLIYGKMKCLDIFYSAREIDFLSGGNRFETIRKFIKKGSYNKKYARFKNCLAFHLSKNSELNIEESNKIIDQAMGAYLRKNYPNNFKFKIKNILNYLPKEIYYKIRLTYTKSKLIFLKPKKDIMDFLNNPSSKYYEDFDRIKKCVISHIKYEK